MVIVLAITAWMPHLFARTEDRSGQIEDTGNLSIKWICQIPAKDSGKDAGFFNRVAEIIVGAKPITVSKPVAVVAVNTEMLWFLDQGNKSLMISSDYEIDIPRFIKKSEIVFPSLVDMCLIPGGNILFTDSKNNKIYLLQQNKKVLKEFNAGLTLDQPTGIAYSKQTQEIWVVETGSHCLAVLNRNGELIRRVGKRGINPGEFNFPTNIWIDNKGSVYIVDALNFRVQILDKEGNFVSAFGEPGNATGFFARPKGIATDSFGNVYVVDALFHAVQVFNRNGKLLHYFGTQGQDKEQFWLPSGIFIDENNYIYIADSFNSRIQIFQVVKEHQE